MGKPKNHLFGFKIACGICESEFVYVRINLVRGDPVTMDGICRNCGKKDTVNMEQAGYARFVPKLNTPANAEEIEA